MTHAAILDLLDQAIDQQRLRPLDVALARFLGERDPAAAPAVLWLAGLLSRQLADGHLCLDLDALAELADEQDWPISWRRQLQTLTTHPHQLADSPLVASDSEGDPASAPLVLDDRRLYLRRYWRHERMVAGAIRARLSRPPPVAGSLATELARLFPDDGGAAPDWPRIACALAARGAFTVITGGPGTGKTTTVVRLLGLLQTLHLQQHDRPLRIRLAAPTGKAAARLNASIASQIARLDVDDGVRRAIPTEVVTLHRLLGARPDSRRFRHDRGNPLHLDVLVVDEASMVDLEMMSAVLAALPPAARLILLGDKDQLSSVEAGAVLGDLCRRAEAGHYSSDSARWLRKTTGDDITPFVREDAQALDQQLAMLRRSHRFGADSGIGQLAAAVNLGDPVGSTRLLREASTDLAWLSSPSIAQLATLAIEGRADAIEPVDMPGTDGPQGYRHYLELLHHRRPATTDADAQSHWARHVLQAFNRFQLLCALRQGPLGVDGLNQLIAMALLERGLIDSAQGWYEGRPVMVTRNDYSLGLANGDVGICLRLPDPQGAARLVVAFLDDSGAGDTAAPRVRQILPSRLGDVVTVYAMTVHKSQGSEFAHTALVLPTETNAVLTRELLYTAITRARHRFSLLGSQHIIDYAIERRTRRHSGLAERLVGD
jgi:exodeoxyribonuclease V alpha subunit